MKAKDVIYDGVLLDEKSVNEIKKLLEIYSIQSDYPFQELMHSTIQYYGPKMDIKEKAKIQLDNHTLGDKVNLKINEIGILKKNNIIQNIGLNIEKVYNDDYYYPTCTHITVKINPETAKAVNTPYCFADEKTLKEFNQRQDEDNYENIIIPLSEPINLTGKVNAFRFNKVSTELEDFPYDYLTEDEKNNLQDYNPSLKIINANELTNDIIKPNVLWFSHHEMTSEQREAIGGDNVNINHIDKTIKNAYELKDEIDAADIIAVVARTDLQQQFLKLADGKPVVTALNGERKLIQQPDGSEDKVKFNFSKWEQIKEIEIEKEDFNFDKYINNKNSFKENNIENER